MKRVAVASPHVGDIDRNVKPNLPLLGVQEDANHEVILPLLGVVSAQYRSALRYRSQPYVPLNWTSTRAPYLEHPFAARASQALRESYGGHWPIRVVVLSGSAPSWDVRLIRVRVTQTLEVAEGPMARDVVRTVRDVYTLVDEELPLPAHIDLVAGMFRAFEAVGTVPPSDRGAPRGALDVVAEGMDLRNRDLRDLDLEGEDRRGALMGLSDLSHKDLRGLDLRGADLELSKLEGADLRGALLTGARVYGALVEGVEVDAGRVYTVEGLCEATGALPARSWW